MAADSDIEIQVSMELEKVLQDLKKLEQSVKASKKTLDNDLNPSVNNTGTKITGFGNKIKGFGDKINNTLNGATAVAFTAAGTAALNFAKTCVDSALTAEREWTRFGSLVNSNGGDWSNEESKIRNWAKTFSNEVGRTVADTREASMAFLEMGLSSSKLDLAMHATAGVAARSGQSQVEAAAAVKSALLGKGKQLEKLTGLRVKDYETADGQIDQERLLNDIWNQNRGAIEDYANTTEGQMSKIQNSWGAFKSSIGKALMPVVKIIADVVTAVAQGFDKMPDGLKTVIAVFVALGGVIGVAIGALGLLAPVLVSLGGMIAAVGSAGGVMAALTAAFPGLGAGFMALASAILPVIAVILAIVAAFLILYKVGKNKGWWTDLNGMFAKFGEVLGQAGAAIMGFVDWFTKLFTDFPAAQAQFREFVDSIGSYIMSGLEFAAGVALNALRDLLLGLANGFVEGMSQLGSDLYNGFASAGTYIWDGIEQLADFALPAIRNVLLSIAQGFVDGLSQFGTEIYNGFVNAWSYISNAGNELLSTIGEMFSSAITGAISYAQNFIGDVAQTFTEMPGKIVDSMGDIGGTILSNIANSMVNVRNGVLSLLEGVMDGLSGLSDIPVVGILFEGLSNSIGLAADMFSIFSSAAIGVVNVFAGLLTGTMSVDDALSSLGEIFSTAFDEVLAVVNEFVGNIIENFMGIGEQVLQAFMTIPTLLGQFFTTLPATIMTFMTTAITVVQLYAGLIVQQIVARFNQLVGMVSQIFWRIVNGVRLKLMQLWTVAGMLAGMIRQVIVTRFNQLVGMARQVFTNIVNTVRSRLQSAVSAARSKAQQIYQGIKDKVSSIPQMVADEFNKIKEKIRTALNNAKSVAVSCINDLVNAVKGALGIASPGFIQRMFTYEFTSLPGIIDYNGSVARKSAANAATGIVNAWADNMTELGIGMSPIPQFDAFRMDMSSAMNIAGQRIANNPYTNIPPVPQQNTTTNNDDHSRVTHIERLEVNLNELPQNEKERWYNMLSNLTRGGA